MAEPVILSAARTPIGKFLGGLSSLSAAELASIVFKAVVERSALPACDLDEVVLGNVVSAGTGMALARAAALAAGLPESLSCYTINKVCGSGLQAVIVAAQAIRAGDARLILAGGSESMSNAPYLLPRARQGYTYGDAILVDSLLHDGLQCCSERWHMGNAAEHIARRFDISRVEMDLFALESHRRAAAAMAAGKFAAEIVPIEIKARKGAPARVEADESPRRDTTLEKLASLKAAFEENGRVTAGNSSPLSDGAAAVMVASSELAAERGLKPLATIRAYATSGVAPREIFHAPSLVIPEVLRRAGLKLEDIGLFEINEAFAAQMLANLKVLQLDPAKVNVHGGALALGHPVGASGARVLATLLYALRDRGLRFGCAALCLGGGNALAMVIENSSQG